MPPELLRVSEAAQRLTVSVRTIYNLVDRGELVLVKIGGASRITAESVARLVDGGAESQA